MRSVPEPEIAGPWLVSKDNGHTVRPELIQRIDWRQINLLDEGAVRALGVFDIVLCRNV